MAIIIKNVWIGSSPIKAADAFNIYAWCALGHRVDVYAHHLSLGTTHTHESLGLQDCDEIGVAPIAGMLLGDSMTMLRSPTWLMAKERQLIQYLLSQLPTAWKDVTMPQLYNLVDLCKSYFGATRQGIVLDLKAGPSEHIGRYAEAFESRFISYNRGGKGSIVENQCMGTMQPESADNGDSLRVRYATKFASVMDNKRDAIRGNPGGSFYNAICGAHGMAWMATKPFNLQVEATAPDGESPVDPYRHIDFIGHWYGPFRVLKEPGNQTHEGGGGRGADFTQKVCTSVYRDIARAKYGPLCTAAAPNDRHPGFLALMEGAIKAIA